MRLQLLVIAAVLAIALAARSAPVGDFVYLVFPRHCFDRFLALDFFDLPCLKATISKCLGYGIIAGACIVKVPQILRFVAARSVRGVSREATYFEMFGYLLQSLYHVILGSPWSAYGETVIVAAQTALITLMLWGYDFPGLVHVLVVTALLGVAAQQTLSAPVEYLSYVQWATTGLFVASRGWQIVANMKQGSTGELAFLTLFMNFAGSAARIFTSAQEVKQVEVMLSFVVSTALNFILLAQYIYYNMIAPKQQAQQASKGIKKAQ